MAERQLGGDIEGVSATVPVPTEETAELELHRTLPFLAFGLEDRVLLKEAHECIEGTARHTGEDF